MSGPFARAVYPIRRLSYLVDLQLGKMLQPAQVASSDIEVTYMRAGHLTSLPEELPTMWASPMDLSRYTVRAGDLLVSEGGDVGRPEFAPPQADGVVIQNSLHRLRVVGDHDIRFLRYGLMAVYLSDWLEVLCNKSTFGHLTAEKLAALQVPVPSIAAQREIADVLDTETARIDALVEKNEALARLVVERYESITERLVWTDPRSGGRWKGVPYRRVTCRVDVGIAEAAVHAYVDDGVPLVRSTNIRRNAIDIDGLLYLDPAFAAAQHRKTVRAGDVLTVRTGATGVSALVPSALDGCQTFTQLISTIRPPHSSAFYAQALNALTARRYFDELRWGSAQDNISVPTLAGAPVPFADPAVQAEVVDTLQRASARFSAVMGCLNRQVGLLRERRQALITAAVTGELDIPRAAA